MEVLEETAKKFRGQLESMLGRRTDYNAVNSRIEAAQKWFTEALEREVLQPLQQHFREWSIKPRSRQYLGDLRALEVAALQLKKGWHQAQQLTHGLAGGTAYADIQLEVPIEGTRLVSGKGDAPLAKPKKGDTYALTLAMYKEGKSIAEIAAERGITAGTVEGHLTRFIPTGEVDISAFVTEEQYGRIVEELQKQEGAQMQGTSLVKAALGETYTYGMIRAVQVQLSKSAVVDTGK
jgi:hypothetical protein